MSVVSPTAPGAPPAVSNRPPSAGTAETLVLVALILQVVGAAIVIGILLLLFGVSAYHLRDRAWVVGLVAGVVGALSLVFLFCAYNYSYVRIREGRFQEAQAPTLVIGILSLFLGLIPGILYLVGYLKLGDALREQQSLLYGYGTPYGPPLWPAASYPQVACRQCGRVSFMGQFAFCPNCGQKLGG